MSGAAGALGSAPGRPLASVAPTDHSLRCGPSPGRRALLRLGLLLKMIFLGRRAAIDKNGALKNHLTQSTSTSAAGCACAA
jgi:hypothetical protein